MAIDPNGDWIGSLLDEQARKNNMLAEGDINDLITDFQAVSGEIVGFQAETVGSLGFTAPHVWGDGSEWGYAQWGASILYKLRWHVGVLLWGDGHKWGD